MLKTSNMNDLGYMVFMDEMDKRDKVVKEICDKLMRGKSFEQNVPKDYIPYIEAEMRRRGRPISIG